MVRITRSKVAVCNRRGQLLVPSHDMVALIRFAEDAEIARLRLKAEQVHQVQGALYIRLAPVLLVIGNIEELPHIGAVAAGDILLDPIIEAEMVKLVPGGRVAVVERGERSVLYLALQHIMHLRKVTIGGLLQVIFIEEEISVLGAHGLGLQKIDGLESKALSHLQDRFMSRIDQLAAPLAGLPVGPAGGIGVHPPSQPRRGLVNSWAVAGIGESQRRHKARDTAADNRDAR